MFELTNLKKIAENLTSLGESKKQPEKKLRP
jgi:hypothetical protein